MGESRVDTALRVEAVEEAADVGALQLVEAALLEDALVERVAGLAGEALDHALLGRWAAGLLVDAWLVAPGLDVGEHLMGRRGVELAAHEVAQDFSLFTDEDAH